MNLKKQYECYAMLAVVSLGLILFWLFGGSAIVQAFGRLCLQQNNAIAISLFVLLYFCVVGIMGFLYKFYLLHKQVDYLTKREKELQFYSYYDALSGTYNRNAFVQKVQSIEDIVDNIAVVVCDIDGLKLINDTLGHCSGDALIRTTAEILSNCASSIVTVYRTGGDEFLLLFTQWNPDNDLEKVIQKIRQAITQHNQKALGLPLSLSIGGATPEDKQANITDLIKLADSRMYQAKKACREKVKESLLHVLTNE